MQSSLIFDGAFGWFIVGLPVAFVVIPAIAYVKMREQRVDKNVARVVVGIVALVSAGVLFMLIDIFT